MSSSILKNVPLVQSSESTIVDSSTQLLSGSRARLSSSMSNQSSRLRRQTQLLNSKSKEKIREVNEKPRERLKPISYCVNINQDGARHMDKVSHLNAEQVENETLENSLRPISGIRNHIKRNLLGNQTEIDIIKDTDLIERIGSVKTLKRLDLSNNNLKKYPSQLCDLNLLESLNLSCNKIDETMLPDELVKYENLVELVLDSNKFKSLPKCVAKLKKLTRLSMRNNSMSDLKNVYHLKKLRYLILDNNLVTELNEKLKNLEKLEILHLNNNSITSIESNLLKHSLNFLKQLDLSSNKLNTVAIEVFTLPLLEVLNLSNNKLAKLPVVPPHNYRMNPLFVCDISSNKLIRFYEFLLMIAKNIDLSANRIRTVPSRLIEKLTLSQLDSKNLKLDENPLLNPPLEVCKQGLKCLKTWFEEENKKIQLNKGFKILLFGDSKSGKTTLTYALEDYNTQSNLIEQAENATNSDETETKFVEIRDFFIKNEPNESEDEEVAKETATGEEDGTVRTISRNVEVMESTPLPAYTRRTSKSGRISAMASFKGDSATSLNNSFKQTRPKTTATATTINAFSNVNLNDADQQKVQNTPKEPKLSRLPVHVYDFNGSISQFTHLLHLFLDKTALILICIDSSCINLNEETNEDVSKTIQANWKVYLKELLDLMILKMNKSSNYYIVPVLTKADKVLKPNSKLNEENLNFNKQIVQAAISKVEEVILNHINSRLKDIRDELKQIESLTNITACHSDRLKQLVQIQSSLMPQMHKQWHIVSSSKMEGIDLLSKDILNLVSNEKKYFPFVNEKVPTFWTEVEKYACNTMCNMYASKLQVANKAMKMRSMLCVDFEYFKDTIIEKYGMSHLIDAITKYMSSSGKIIWFQDSEKYRQKVFLKPQILFDLLFVLFRTVFSENFADNYARNNKPSKYFFTLNEETITKYTNELLMNGCLNLDLLKLLWYPILTVESSDLVQSSFILLSQFFNIGYPEMTKDKMKILYKEKLSEEELAEAKPTFTQMIIPFYLPMAKDKTILTQLRTELRDQCSKAIASAVKLKLKKETPKLLSKLSHQYSFPWGIKSGIFERFSTHLLLNTELCYKQHYKNLIQAYNEENSIGVLINKHQDKVTFEFYIVNYQHVVESLKANKNKEERFEQTLTMDLDQLWLLGLRVLQLFEDVITASYQNLRFDRHSMCPECERFSFLGEWLTPKELQKNKFKNCPHCDQLIENVFLVKPSTGQNPTLDFKKLQQRLENIAQNEIRKSATNIEITSLSPTKSRSNMNNSNINLKN